MTSEVAGRVVGLLLEILWKSTLLFGAAGILALALRRAPAAWRHLTWASYLGALLLLPLVSALLPTWTVPVLPGAIPPARRLAAGPSTIGQQSAPVPATASSVSRRESNRRQRADAPARAAHPRPQPWQLYGVGVWAMGVLAASLRMLLSLAAVSRLEQNARTTVDGPIFAALAKLCRELGAAGHVVLLLQVESEPVTPMTWGLLRPTLLLPESASEWPADRVRSVLRHELAHVRRRDWAVSLMAEAVCAVYWFQPLAWCAAARLRAEAEAACDDAVICAVPAADYARHLVEVVRDLAGRNAAVPAAVTMAQPAHLEARIRAILDTRRRRGRLTPAAGMAALVLAVALAAPLAAVRAAAERVSTSASHPIEAHRASGPALVTLDAPPRMPKELSSGRTGVLESSAARTPSAPFLPLAPEPHSAPLGIGSLGRSESPNLKTPDTVPVGKIRWGKAQDGLQCGLRFTDPRGEYTPGETFTVEIRVRNLTREPRTLRLETITGYMNYLYSGNRLHLDPLHGETTTLTLAPGENCAVPGSPYTRRLGTPGQADAAEASLPLDAGRYLLTVSAPLLVPDEKDPSRASALPARPGTLELRVVAPRGAHPSFTPVEPGQRGIAWGPISQGLQAGLAFVAGASTCPVGGTIRMESWLRNTTGRTYPVGHFHSRNEFMDQPPALIGPGDAVDYPSVLRWDILPVLQQVTLAPGQALLLGHPELTILDKDPDQPRDTPTVVAPPGEYRLRQSPSVRPNGAALDLMLETGKQKLRILPPAQNGN